MANEDLQKFLKDIEGLDLEQTEELLAEINQLEMPADLTAQNIAISGAKSTDVRHYLAGLSVAGKLKAAIYGNDVVRGILIHDSNKIIQQAVLKNPRIGPDEIEEFSKSTNSSDLVLRIIANSRSWMKSYQVKLGLVANPKTPQDIGIKWLRHLMAPDLKKISQSKNVPQVISSTAKKIMADIKDK